MQPPWNTGATLHRSSFNKTAMKNYASQSEEANKFANWKLIRQTRNEKWQLEIKTIYGSFVILTGKEKLETWKPFNKLSWWKPGEGAIRAQAYVEKWTMMNLSTPYRALLRSSRSRSTHPPKPCKYQILWSIFNNITIIVVLVARPFTKRKTDEFHTKWIGNTDYYMENSTRFEYMWMPFFENVTRIHHGKAKECYIKMAKAMFEARHSKWNNAEMINWTRRHLSGIRETERIRRGCSDLPKLPRIVNMIGEMNVDVVRILKRMPGALQKSSASCELQS